MQFLTSTSPFRYKSNAAQINNVLARLQKDWQQDFTRDAFDHSANFNHRYNSARTPAVDVLEFDDAYSLEIELPGVDKEAINITVEDGVLSIAAGVDKTEEQSDTEAQTLRRERYQGKVTRQFSLGEHADENAIEAKLENGVLKIRIAKLVEEPSKAKHIEVQ